MIKEGVILLGVSPEVVWAWSALQWVFRRYGYDAVVTACVDGKHMRASLHYSGHAMDIRSRDIPPLTQQKILTEGKVAIGENFDFILEGDHFHLEFQPKLPYGV